MLLWPGIEYGSCYLPLSSPEALHANIVTNNPQLSIIIFLATDSEKSDHLVLVIYWENCKKTGSLPKIERGAMKLKIVSNIYENISSHTIKSTV